MRVTHKLMADNAIRHMDENLQRLYSLQEKIASEKQFQRASENPSGAIAALSLRSSLAISQAYLDTAHLTDSWLSASDSALSQMTDVARRALNLVLKGANDTLSAVERRTMASEIDSMVQEAVGVGNTSHQGNFLFSGFKTTTKPFSLSDPDPDEDNLPAKVSYTGDNGTILRNIGPEQSIPQNIDGNTIFQPVFDALVAARKALKANDSGEIQTAIGLLQNAFNGLGEAVTTNGARMRQVDLITSRIENTQIELRSLLSKKEDINMAEAITALRYQETVYQAALEVGHRAISALSLFDIMS